MRSPMVGHWKVDWGGKMECQKKIDFGNVKRAVVLLRKWEVILFLIEI
jgi:hypothetical protein